MVIKAQDRLLKKFCPNAQHRRGPAEETQEVESQLLSTRAQKQLCAGVITQRKWSGRGNESKSLECGRSAASREELVQRFSWIPSLVWFQWGAATRRTWYSLTRVPLVGSLCHCARRLLWNFFLFLLPPPLFFLVVRAAQVNEWERPFPKYVSSWPLTIQQMTQQSSYSYFISFNATKTQRVVSSDK